MYFILKSAHSGLRYLVLVLLIAVIVNALQGLARDHKQYSNFDAKLSLFALISVHTQWLLGMCLYFISPLVRFGQGMMSDPQTRYWSVEHITANTIAVVLFTISHSKAKRQTESKAKFKTHLIYTGLGLLLLIISLSAKYAPGPFGSSL